MSLNKVFMSCVVVFCALSLSPSYAATFAEKNGVVMMEVESSAPKGGWKLQRSLSGYSGSGYYIWTGTDAFSKGSAGRGAITYTFRIAKAGNYQMRWRSRIGKGTSRTEHNDSWVRFPTGKNVRGEQALSGWTKVFMNTRDKWVWQSATVDRVGKSVRQYFSAGVHTVQISGRSSGHAIDKIALYRYDSVSFSASKFDSLPNSGTGASTSAPSRNPEPIVVAKPEPVVVVAKPEPVVVEPVVVAEPVAEPVVEPVISSDPVSIAAPAVSVSNNTLSWPTANAIVINVHRGTGEWLESLPASTTSWQAPSAGTYYLVATGEGSWETWGRSATVSVAESVTASDGPKVTAQVYSDSALELFWNDGGIAGLSFEVQRNGQLQIILDGRSYFDDGLAAGTRYNYTITAINAAGDVVWEQGVSTSTLGGSANQVLNDGSGNTGDISLNLTAKAYSQSAIELFWNNDQLDAGSSYSFSVYQNGELVKVTDGRSHFIEGLTAGTQYQMSVIATDAASSQAVSNAVDVTTYAVDNP